MKLFKHKYKEQLELQISLNKELLKELKELKKHNPFIEFNLEIHEYLDNVDYINKLEPKEKTVFLAKASQVHDTEAFQTVIKELMKIQANHSILQAPNEEARMFDRAGINAMQLLKKEFKKLDAMHKDEGDEDEDYDKNKVI